MVEKLVKALEGLKIMQAALESSTLRKNKMTICVSITDLVVNLRSTGAHDIPQVLSHVVETFINLCNDQDSDVRMVADECLNRIIRALSDTNMLRIQIELHREIKKNGPARSLRAALMKFSQLSPFIRPQKGRGHVQNLVPCLLEISKREEESVHETLAQGLTTIFQNIGVYTNDSDVKNLLQAFLVQLSSSSAVIRRSCCSSLVTIVQNCRKPHIFTSYLLNNLLDCLIPVSETNSTCLILGVMTCLRMLIPHLTTCSSLDDGLGGSFGLKRKQDETVCFTERLLQVYELCLHYTNHSDHNVVTCALECLSLLLQSSHEAVTNMLTSPTGIPPSQIYNRKEGSTYSNTRTRTMSEASNINSTIDGDDLFDEQDTTWALLDKPESKTKEETEVKVREKFSFVEDEGHVIYNPFQDQSLAGDSRDAQYTPDFDSDAESSFYSILPTITKQDTLNESADNSRGYSRSNSKDELDTLSLMGEYEEQLNIGSIADTEVPLVYCTRYLVSKFLLNNHKRGIRSDRSVRVSIKSLVLTCITNIVKMYPAALKLSLAKQGCDQYVSEILLFSKHSDPQIRGVTSNVVTSYLTAAIIESRGDYKTWLKGANAQLDLCQLILLILESLRDDSSVCSRQAVSSLHPFLNVILSSNDRLEAMTLLKHLPTMVNNSYWLVKAKLVEVLSYLDFVIINDITGNDDLQNQIVDDVLFVLLADEDSRVRTATAEALTRLIGNLTFSDNTALSFCQRSIINLNNFLEDTDCENIPSHLFPSFIPMYQPSRCQVENALSRIIVRLNHFLLVADTKNLLQGCIEVLLTLASKYPPVQYPNSWANINLFNYLLTLLITSTDTANLTTLTHLTKLVAELYIPLSLESLKKVGESTRLWDIFGSKAVSQLSEQYITHLMKVLNIYYHVLDEIPLNRNMIQPGALLQLGIPSPIRRVGATQEKEEEKKHKNMENNNTQWQYNLYYFKIYQFIKSSYNSYKISLNQTSSDMLFDLLAATINSVSILLEIATVKESGRIAEELLCYLKCFTSYKPVDTIACVIQLLKSLFGSNLISYHEICQVGRTESECDTLCGHVFQIPSQALSDIVRDHSKTTAGITGSLPSDSKRMKVTSKGADKTTLATYIKLFEPIVIRALKQYTISADVILQCHVLQLLSQLIQLRVNYCLLDADGIFINFIQKQFILIEQGQTKNTGKLLPSIFQFLVLLSDEKQHSKSLMTVPRILQLCDGLMASGQSPITHCIPGLIPVVEDVFLSRRFTPATDQRELETQKEVLLAMLLRLAEFHEVVTLLSLILTEYKQTNVETWKRLSSQIMEVILPLVSLGRLRVESSEGQVAFNKLLNSLSPNVLRPSDPLLKVLFSEPCLMSNVSFERWFGGITIVFLNLLHIKEDILLSRMEDVLSFIGQDPALHFCQFLINLLELLGHTILANCSDSLEQKIQQFLLCIIYVLESGKFHRIANAMEEYLSKETSNLVNLNDIYLKLSDKFPLLTVQYNYLLTLVNGSLEMYMIIVASDVQSLNYRIVKYFAIINVMHYLCENHSDVETLKHVLINNINEVILLSNEPPVRELLLSITRRTAECTLYIQTISTRCNDLSRPKFVEKLLRTLEGCDMSLSGPLVFVLIKKFLRLPHLSLVRLAICILCRRIEWLLTLSSEDVRQQMDKEMFESIIRFLNESKLGKRHCRLMSLLNKLGEDVYDMSPDEIEEEETLNPHYIKATHVDQQWYFHQVRTRCCQSDSSDPALAELLSKLNHKEITQIMSCKEFNLHLLEDCFKIGAKLKKCNIHDVSNNEENDTLDYRENLYKASKELLFSLLSGIRRLLPRSNEVLRVTDTLNVEYCDKLLELVQDNLFYSMFFKLAPALTVFMRDSDLGLDADGMDCVIRYCVASLEILNLIKYNSEDLLKPLTQFAVETQLNCIYSIIKNDQIFNVLTQPNYTLQFNSFVVNLVDVIKSLEKCISSKQDFEILAQFLKINDPFGSSIIRNIIVRLCRSVDVSTKLLNVPEEIDVQDLDVLQELISRMSVIGWSNRHQFEEIWVCFLTVIGFSNDSDSGEDTSYVVQVISTAVDGITTLLSKALLHPQPGNSTKFIHHSRDVSTINQYKNYIHEQSMKLSFDSFTFLFEDLDLNLEFIGKINSYRVGQLSVEYIWSSLQHMGCDVALQKQHAQLLTQSGVDLSSCLHLLVDLFSQWSQQYRRDIRILSSIIRSAVIISDLFLDISQYQWLLDFCLNIEELVACSDSSSLLPQLIIGSCKAAAITLPDLEVCEKLKRMMLRSSSIAARTATVKGLLYLLQAPVVYNQMKNKKEEQYVNNISVMFLPIALEIIQDFKSNKTKNNIEYEIHGWSLIFYMLEFYESTLSGNSSELISWVITIIRTHTHPTMVVTVLNKGLERLLLSNRLSELEKEQVLKSALDRVSHSNVVISQSGLRLLIAVLYVDKEKIADESDTMMKNMEILNVLFEKLRRGYKHEADVIGNVLSLVLTQLQPSDVLTKVIQEFLFPQQPYLNILSSLLLQVFERAEQSLLEDWVVFSLPSFIQGMSLPMSVWTLTVFFVASSCHDYLKYLYPLVQSRLRCCDTQDKTLLCISARHFYYQLKTDSQRTMFFKSFRNASESNVLFEELVNCLQ